MIKRTIEISREPAHLTVRDGQLLILRKDPAEKPKSLPANPPNLVASIPCEDLGMVMVDNRETTFSLSALATLAEHGAALCVCGGHHLPVGLLLPLSDRHETVWRIKDQAAIRLPTKKRLWRQIVRAKVRAQAINLPEGSPGRLKLINLLEEVRSGDPTNVEAQAAKVYWSVWLGEGKPFRRISDPYSPPKDSAGGSSDAPAPNALLNYGYAVLRAAVARAIVSAGLLPALGIYHDSRSNPFCLADDLVEPLRPLVDRMARTLFLQGEEKLVPNVKGAFLALLTAPMRMGSREEATVGPLMVALPRYIASFVACLPSMGPKQRLTIPIWVDPVAPDQPRTRARTPQPDEADLFGDTASD